MAMIECRECKVEISDEASRCPKCGARTKPGRWGKIFIVSAGILAGGLWVLTEVYDTPEARENAVLAKRIEDCWAQWERKSMDPQTKLFIARGCEGWERELREKRAGTPKVDPAGMFPTPTPSDLAPSLYKGPTAAQMAAELTSEQAVHACRIKLDELSAQSAQAAAQKGRCNKLEAAHTKRFGNKP